MKKCARAVAVCLLWPAAAALGQLATSPPEHILGPEERIARVEINRQTTEPPPAAPLPGFKTLVVRDVDGNVLPLREPIEWAALLNNPLVTREDMARIEPELAARRKAFDRIVIDNLDLAEQIDDGIFEKIDLGDNKAFTKLLDVSKPFRPADLLPMSKSLFNKGLLTRDQEALNNKIVQEYKLAALPELPANANAAQKGQNARRSLAAMYKQGMDEPLFELRRMRLAAAERLPELIPALRLNPDAERAAMSVAEQVRAANGERNKLEQLDRLKAWTTLEQRRELLRGAADQR